eukprot:4525517-Amphidinium_carterae.1
MPLYTSASLVAASHNGRRRRPHKDSRRSKAKQNEGGAIHMSLQGLCLAACRKFRWGRPVCSCGHCAVWPAKASNIFDTYKNPCVCKGSRKACDDESSNHCSTGSSRPLMPFRDAAARTAASERLKSMLSMLLHLQCLQTTHRSGRIGPLSPFLA